MSLKTKVSTGLEAPNALHSQAIISNGMIYCSGSVGVDLKTKKFVEGGVGARTAQAIRNLALILEKAGSHLNNTVKVNVFLTTMDDYDEVNKVYRTFFAAEPKPVRTCVAVHQLPFGTDVEVELVAHAGTTTQAKL
ncbi:yabJ protein [Xylona heveae TC161]|uniref:YabJ protein n=1 Tax=Xylona heveae (strain CBS 132557 / TC161) TaxID=1328760 RepID=A0A165IMH9_XYLHT|nr:yabJ protein [Xylona heveae TC161]KZF25109.1 yabJ protein [Xylona heveae TC161]